VQLRNIRLIPQTPSLVHELSDGKASFTESPVYHSFWSLYSKITTFTPVVFTRSRHTIP